jgi:hypothetical protein
MISITKHLPIRALAAHLATDASLDQAAEIAREAVKTAFSPSNGLSEQQAWAAAMWAEVSLEMSR